MKHEEIKDFVLTNLTMMSAFPSLTGAEEKFGLFLHNLFSAEFNRKKSSMRFHGSRHVYDGTGYLYSSLIMDKEYPYVFTAHLDRVGRYVNTIKDSPDLNTLSGQLDNLIGLVILYYLASRGHKINVLFTTHEEACESWPQLEEFIKLNPHMKPVSIDIDVYNNLEEFEDGHISIRDKDKGGKFNKPLVEKMREIAAVSNIPVNTGEKGWSYVETSMLQSHTGLSGANIGIPLVNYHSPREVTNWNVIYNCIEFLEKFIIKTKGESHASDSKSV